MEEGSIRIWIDHGSRLISGTPLAAGVLYCFRDLDALCAFCQPLLADRYRLQ